MFDEERAIAVAQHLGMEIFNHEDEYYIGDEEALFADYEYHIEEDGDSFEDFTEYLESEATRLDDEVEVCEWGCGEYYEADGQEFRVLTDSEADNAWDESLDNYIDECVLPEIPEHFHFYFDDERFKEDCKMDGRGHSLSHYDGYENEEDVNGETYYIYRTN